MYKIYFYDLRRISWCIFMQCVLTGWVLRFRFYEKLKNEITNKQSHHSSTNNTGLNLPRKLTDAKTQTVLPDTIAKISSENGLQNTLMQLTVLNSLTDDVDDIDELSLELFNSYVATNDGSCL